MTLLRTLFSNPFLRFRLAIGWGLAAGLAAALLSLRLPNQYRSVSRVLPIARAAAPAGGLQALQALSGLGAGGNLENALPEILKSRTVLDPVLATAFVFHAASWRFGPMKERCMTLEDFLAAPDRDAAVQNLQAAMAVVKDFRTGVLVLEVTLPSADLARQVNEALIRGLDAFLKATRNERGRNLAEFMGDRVQVARGELQSALADYLAYAGRNRSYAQSLEPLVRVEGQKRELEVEFKKQVLLRIQSQVEAAILEEKDATPVLSMLDRATLPIAKAKPARLRMALGGACLGFGAALAWSLRRRIWGFYAR